MQPPKKRQALDPSQELLCGQCTCPSTFPSTWRHTCEHTHIPRPSLWPSPFRRHLPTHTSRGPFSWSFQSCLLLVIQVSFKCHLFRKAHPSRPAKAPASCFLQILWLSSSLGHLKPLEIIQLIYLLMACPIL